MRKLFDGDIEGYFKTNADFKDAFWFFVHIPKTAGSSFRRELANALKPNANITLNYAVDGNEFDNWRKRAVSHFVGEHTNKKHRFASGHIMNSLLNEVRATDPNTRCITMLRNPVERVISDYRYARTPTHPPYKDFIKRYPNILDYVSDPDSANKMSAFLEISRNQPIKELISQIESTFAFVGLTEMYPLSRRTLFRLLNIRAGAIERQRTTSVTDDNYVEDSNELRQAIIKANARDVELYRHFRTNWLKHRQQVINYLNERHRGNKAASDAK